MWTTLDLNEPPRCSKCGRVIPEGYSICPCWTADDLLEFGIDPVAWRRTPPSPPEPLINEDWEKVKEGARAMTYQDVPPREMRKEEATQFERGTLSLREENLLIKGHLAYVENIVKELRAKKGKKYAKYE